MNKLPTIIFLIGILMLIITHITTLKTKNVTHKDIITMTIWVIVSLIVIGFSWILRETQIKKEEDYHPNDYDYAIQSGQLVSGTVFASYPQQVGGLGWVL